MPDDQSKCLYGDSATDTDSLGFEPYVQAIAEFLTNKNTKPPITLSIEGPWGCGKTSFMRQLKKEIDSKGKEECTTSFTVWFNCWRYEKEDELWAAFALNLMEQLSSKLSWGQKLRAQFNLMLLRFKFKWRSMNSFYFHILILIVAVYVLKYSLTSILDFSLVNSSSSPSTNIFVMLTGLIASILAILSIMKDIVNVIGNPLDLRKFLSNPDYMEHSSFIENFHSDFAKIIEAYAGSSRVYVFIDDLDRCEIPKAAELMQALNLMISDNVKICFAIGMDRKIISAGIAAKNEKVIKYLDADGLKYGYDFIEKFIQLPFQVPSPKREDFLRLVRSFGDEGSSDSRMDVNKGKETATDSHQHYEGSSDFPHDEDTVKSKVVFNPINSVMESNKQMIYNGKDCSEDYQMLSAIIEMIAPALDNNPRRIKQFINLFRFQRIIGDKIDLFYYDTDNPLGVMWNCKKLAKFVAISIKWPSLVSALSSNMTLLEQLQKYALNPKESYGLENWIKDGKLITLLRHGCDKDEDEYTLSGLDLSKLLEISPDITSFDSMHENITYMEFVQIPPGEFEMGSPDNEDGRSEDEGPVHKVTINYSFEIGKYTVTQKQWTAIMGYNPSHFRGKDRPVENISWNEVKEFILKLNSIVGAYKYRLPSEAEWEYACRIADEQTGFSSDESKFGNYAWYSDNSGDETHPVGLKKLNPTDLCDMHGNVWEWCQDRWHPNYKDHPSDGSAWEDGNDAKRVIRGGSWRSNIRNCRTAERFGNSPKTYNTDMGFRLIRNR